MPLFTAPRPPIAHPLLVLNGEGRRPINNLCIPTVVAPSYGPGDKSLVSVTVLGIPNDSNQLLLDVRTQLTEWFGAEVQYWRHLRTYSIPYALPNQASPALSMPERPVRWQSGIYICGIIETTLPYQGAMVSGRRAAEAVLEDTSMNAPVLGDR